MSRNIDARLRQLNVRRKGLDRLGTLTGDAATEIASQSSLQEKWERSSNKPNSKYAIGAMQEVGPEYTKVSVETATRVGNQLKSGLTSEGFSVDFRLQGSVPLNVHIRGASDVDLLTLDTSFHTYDRGGWGAKNGRYIYPSDRRPVDVLMELRAASEKLLERVFYAATVDKKGGKAIAISGGSLARSVDVVPSIWHDNSNYQLTQQESDRTVVILNKSVPETINNLPFLHIKNVHTQDSSVTGGLKKAIRLCKNVKNDAKEEGTAINLPSFDIAALMYHADKSALSAHGHYELSVLAEVQRFLDYLCGNKSYAKLLRTPDDSRFVIDNDAKMAAVTTLSIELDDLAREVTKEQSGYTQDSSNIGLNEAREYLASKRSIQ